MKALYRKYRPTKLTEVVGQPQVTDPLIKSLDAGKVNHAYLFVGPRGCGKTSVARILAHEVNGFKYEIEDDYVDIIEIDGASNRGIDNIRELREKVAIAPSTGKYKVYIIDEVHMLTKEAFNALLKTLEEPPAHAIFIMATTDVYKVPITIISRAQTYTFKLADEKVMFDFLKEVVGKEKIKIDDDALSVIVRRGGGSFRDSLSLLEQISTLSDKAITKKMVVNAMGLPQDEKINELLALYNQDLGKISVLLKELLCSGIKAETLSEEMISHILAEPKTELLPLLAKLPDVKAPYAEAKLLVAMAQIKDGSTHRDVRPNVLNTPSVTQKGNIPKVAQTPGVDFDWNGFVGRVQELSDAVYSQLMKTSYKFDGTTLSIYPKRKIVRNILVRDNNRKILFEAAGPNVKITICEENETPVDRDTDETIVGLSAIMGGEVVNDKGGNPFEE